MKVRELMATDVKSCPDYSTLNTAAQTMWENDIGCVPIVDKDNHVIGMVTDRDICMAAYLQGTPLRAASVMSAMSREVFSCRGDDDVASAEKLMRDKQIHRLPVMDAQKRLVGIISLNDIAREAAREAEMKKVRQVSDAEVTELIASVCAPRHRIIGAQAAA
jgi:CBS domain-containing protein